MLRLENNDNNLYNKTSDAHRIDLNNSDFIKALQHI